MIEQVILEQLMIFEELLYTVLAMPAFYVITLACTGIVAIGFKFNLYPDESFIILTKIGVYLVKYTAYHTGAFIIDTGSDTLNRYSETTQSFSFPGAVMICASTGPRGHQSRGQSGFNQTRDTGSSSDDDADGNHSASVERNEPAHQGKRGWEKRLLEKHNELEARLTRLEEAAANDTEHS